MNSNYFLFVHSFFLYIIYSFNLWGLFFYHTYCLMRRNLRKCYRIAKIFYLGANSYRFAQITLPSWYLLRVIFKVFYSNKLFGKKHKKISWKAIRMIHSDLGVMLIFELLNFKIRSSFPSNYGFGVFFDYPFWQRLISSKKFWVFWSRILFFEFLFWIFVNFRFANYLWIFYCGFWKTHKAFI